MPIAKHQRNPVVPVAKPSTATLINFQDLHEALVELRDLGAKNVDFKGLLETELWIRRDNGLAVERPILGFASVDTRIGPDDPQDRFARAVENAGIALERIDFRDAYVNPPEPIGQRRPDEGEPRPGVQTLAAPVSFAMGALATRENASVVLFAGRFDHAYAVRHFAERGGSVYLAFWRSCIDPRFFSRHIDSLPRVKFINLEDHPAVLGGFDFESARGDSQAVKRSPLSTLF